MTKLLLRTIALATVVLVGSAATAQADRDSRRFQRGFKKFFSCAFTPKLRFDGTIVDAALEFESLSTLAEFVQAAGLAEVLSGEGPFTVYAPVNTAFEALPEAFVAFLAANPTEDLASVLALHVSPGEGYAFDPRLVADAREVKTLQPDGQTVFFNRSGKGPQVNQSDVDCQGVQTTNGTVWLINSVLMPQYLSE